MAFDHLRDHRDNLKSQYIIVTYDISAQDTINHIFNLLNKLNKFFSKDTFKKNFINKKLYPVIEYIKNKGEIETKKLNSVIFIDHGKGSDFVTIEEYDLTKEQLLILRKFKCKNYWIDYGEYFDIDKLEKYINNNEYDIIVKVNGNKISQLWYGQEKRRLVESIEKKSFNLDDYLKKLLQIKLKKNLFMVSLFY